MAKAHAHFYFLRKSLYEKYFGTDINDDYLNILKRGVGGLQDTIHIKCLHLHYAHYRICESNIAFGRIAYHLLQQNRIAHMQFVESRCKNDDIFIIKNLKKMVVSIVKL